MSNHPLKPCRFRCQNDKITVSSLNSAYSHQDSHDTHWVYTSSNSPAAVFAFDELQPILEESVSVSLQAVCVDQSVYLLPSQMKDKSGDIGGHSSRWTPFSCKKLSIILARWGLAFSSWKMTFWPIWQRYSTTWGRRISSIYRRPFNFQGTTTRAVLSFKLVPAHIT